MIGIEITITDIEKAEIQQMAYTVSRDYSEKIRKLLFSHDLLEDKVKRLNKQLTTWGEACDCGYE